MRFPDSFYGGLGWHPDLERQAVSNDPDERAAALGLGQTIPEDPFEPQRPAQERRDASHV